MPVCLPRFDDDRAVMLKVTDRNAHITATLCCGDLLAACGIEGRLLATQPNARFDVTGPLVASADAFQFHEFPVAGWPGGHSGPTRATVRPASKGACFTYSSDGAGEGSPFL